MYCQHCGGEGQIGVRAKVPEGAVPLREYTLVPCPDCNGSGIGSCCEGDIPVGPVIAEKKNG